MSFCLKLHLMSLDLSIDKHVVLPAIAGVILGIEQRCQGECKGMGSALYFHRSAIFTIILFIPCQWMLYIFLLIFRITICSTCTCYFKSRARDSITRYFGRSNSHHLLFRRLWAVLYNRSCPNAGVSLFITAPAHPHATSVAVYPALFQYRLLIGHRYDFRNYAR